jgi:hypothetical protein
MKLVDDNWSRTCKHCFGSGLAVLVFDRSGPHAIDHQAYRDGVPRPDTILALEQADRFWKTLGGCEHDPWGDGGETLRQRAKAVSLGIGMDVYRDMQP